MCNLNILITKKPSYKNYGVLMERLTTLSYESNNDADGVYFSGTNYLEKSTYKLNYTKMSKHFNKSHFVISHQRLTTSGYDESNHQPFHDEGFAIAHNGVLSGIGTEEKSDTRIFFGQFVSEFYRVMSESEVSREAAVISTLRTLFKQEWGSYSIVIYDKVDKCLYYFKNTSTSINAYHTDEYIYLSTKQTSFWQDPKAKTIPIDAMKIYKATVTNKLIVFKPVGEIEREAYNHDWYDDNYSPSFRGYQHKRLPDNVTVIDHKNDPRILTYCDECGLFGHCMERERYNYDILCKDCYNYRRKYEFLKGEDSYPKLEEMSDKEYEKHVAKRKLEITGLNPRE